MATVTGERLAELKREVWPRFNLDHIRTATEGGTARQALLSAAEVPAHAAIINAYLRHFVPGDCPSCSYGHFGWGIAHGSGNCSCGWPGTLYHRIVDDRELDTLICSATCNGYDVCGRLRGDHVVHEWHGIEVSGDRVVTGTELRCPTPKAPPGITQETFTSRYHAPLIVRFDALLWAHPYDVHKRS